MGGRALGHGENNNVSNDDIVTVAGASSATPPVLQEVLATGVQALEIASQLTISGWQQLTLLYTIHGKIGGGKYKDFPSFSCDNRPVHNNNVLKLNPSWCLGFPDSNFIINNIISIWGMWHWEDEIVKGALLLYPMYAKRMMEWVKVHGNLQSLELGLFCKNKK